jgi:hypothetical protein
VGHLENAFGFCLTSLNANVPAQGADAHARIAPS